MNCQEFWNRLSRPPGCEAGLDAGLRAHLLECPLCAAHYARQRELARGLRQLADDYSGVQAPSRLEARLLRAFRAQHGAPPAEGRRWLAPLTWAAATALAAGLFLVSAPQPAPPAATAGLASLETPAAVVIDETSPEAEGFIPLPNAERIGPGDGFNLVRVEVPRSAMMAVGIPVSADQASDPVEADVLLGSDGLARAVRFLD
jgi:anti-sigma factor RsiW